MDKSLRIILSISSLTASLVACLAIEPALSARRSQPGSANGSELVGAGTAGNAALNILYCNDEQRSALEAAWTSAQFSLTQLLIAINSPLYDLFFSERAEPSKDQLARLIGHITNQSPHFDRTPAVACASPDVIDKYYPTLRPSAIDDCLDQSRPARYVTHLGTQATDIIFLCGDKFFATPRVINPRRQPTGFCPPVVANRFQVGGGFPLAQSLFLILGMGAIYTHMSPPFDINRWRFMDWAIVARKDPKGLSFGAFVYSQLLLLLPIFGL